MKLELFVSERTNGFGFVWVWEFKILVVNNGMSSFKMIQANWMV